ncbi:MAG TPA: glycosyltransferase family 4 protein [Pyrinomonadaceae bacterium]|nr:glycosyltransferase family 4 protein [Pyrinomonadaceae bacterium]
MTIGLAILAFFLTFGCVWIFRRAVTENSRLLDIPNERSSHTVPVTRGAGIAIVFSVLAIYLAVLGTAANLSYIIGAIAIAIVSFLDDLFSVPLLIRLAIHIAAAVFFVNCSGSYVELSAWTTVNFGLLAPWITVIFIVWMINAFNFMDGIDGIAGAQGFGAALGWTILGSLTGSITYSTLGAILLGACSGFLVFNWQPAKVFMGDVGSTFLGFTFGVFPLIDPVSAAKIAPSALTTTIIFLWLFVFDTAFTRFWQVFRLTAFWRPHREHLYQQLVHNGAPHGNVAAYFGICAVFTAIAVNLAGTSGWIPLAVLLVFAPAGLAAWAWKKRLT